MPTYYGNNNPNHIDGDQNGLAENDTIWGDVQDIEELPEVLIDRLRHYFATYKMALNKPNKISIEDVYGCEHAMQVVEAAMADYEEEFGGSGIGLTRLI